MTNTDFDVHRERLLALRARLLGDMTQMEDNALNKDHSKTTSMPNHMAELGTGNFDQELTLSLLEATRTPSTRSKRQSSGSRTAATASARSAVERSPRPAWKPSLMPPSASDVHRKKKACRSRPDEDRSTESCRGNCLGRATCVTPWLVVFPAATFSDWDSDPPRRTHSTLPGPGTPPNAADPFGFLRPYPIL